MEFWELEDHEVAYTWLRAFKIMPKNGILGTRRPRNALLLAKKRIPRFPRIPSGSRPDPTPWGVMMLYFDTTRNLSLFAVK
eukprot:3801695-Pyramimonas_sp.AAC.1